MIWDSYRPYLHDRPPQPWTLFGLNEAHGHRHHSNRNRNSNSNRTRVRRKSSHRRTAKSFRA
jgi:hypothetical protein